MTTKTPPLVRSEDSGVSRKRRRCLHLRYFSTAAHTPRPRLSAIQIVKLPPSPVAASSRPIRRVAEQSKEERRTSGLFEGGALDSQVSDSQYIDSLESFTAQVARQAEADVVADADDIDAQHIGDSASAEGPEDEHFPGQLEYWERHSGIEAFYEDMAAHAAQNFRETAPVPATPSGSNPAAPSDLQLMTFVVKDLPAEDRKTILDIVMLISGYREDAERLEKRVGEVERAHRDLKLECHGLRIINGDLIHALDEAGVPLPPSVTL
ncbi:hypothetical protein C8Q77DRAFT_1069761 [Trametes polyzona]|nr:hypothetical protein C8Q77DRAFT_1069761 [Trametes polyzona]